MRSTASRAESVRIRMRQLRDQRKRRILAAYRISSFILFLGLCTAIKWVSGSSEGSIPGLYGSALLYRSAGGYVLTAVIAFMTGVIITVVLIRKHGKKGSGTGNL